MKLTSLSLAVAVSAIPASFPLPGGAQAVAVSPPVAQTPVDRIMVDFTNTPLAEAIWIVSRRSGVDITFNGALPPKKVTYRAPGVTLDVALSEILRGTGLQAVKSREGLVIVNASTAQVNRVQGVVAGRVTDAKTGKGIAGASISAGKADGVTTAEDGRYRITGVTPGVHTITVRLIGYAKQTQVITVAEGATVTADFKLEPSANVLDQVIVTGTVVQTELKAVPNAITIVTAKEIEERGITRIDQLFRGDVPGIFVPIVGSASLVDKVTIFSRGATSIPNNANLNATSTPIKTYIDGVELADPSYISQIDPRSIERIEILTGPQASTIYGSNAINGVMQIFTKRGSTSRSQLALNLFSGFVESNFSEARTPQHDYSVQVNGAEQYLSYNIGGAWNYMGPWTPSKQTTRINGFGGMRLEMPIKAGRVTGDVTFKHSTTNNNQRGDQGQRKSALYENGWYAPAISMGLVTPTNQSLAGQTLGLVVNYVPISWWSHEVEVGRDVGDLETRSQAPIFRTISDSILFLQQTHTGGRSLRYTTTARANISFAQATITVGADSWQNLNSDWYVFSKILTGTLTGSPSISRQPGHNTGGFLQTQIGLKDQLFFTYGLRAEWNPTFGDEVSPSYAPRYGVAYTSDIGIVTTKLRASYGRATRPPIQKAKLGVPLEQVFVEWYGAGLLGTFANPSLLPEIQQGWEGGMEMYLGSRASLVVTRYNQTVDDLISYVNTDSVDVLPEIKRQYGIGDWESHIYQNMALNIGTIRNQGWELQGTMNIGPIRTRGTYSWTKSRVLGITPRYRPQLTETKYLPGASFNKLAEHTWALGITYAKAANTVGLNIRGVGPIIIGGQDEFYYKNLANNIRFLSNRLRVDPVNYYGVNKANAIIDMTASRRVSSRLEGVLQIFNLADLYQKNELSGFYVTTGRQAKMGFRLRTL